MTRRDLSLGVSAAQAASPPLTKAVDRDVVQAHLGVDAQHSPAGGAQAHAQLGLLARDQALVERARSAQEGDAHHRVAVAGCSLSDRYVPLHVHQAVVDVGVASPFPAPARDDGGVRPSLHRALAHLEPRGLELAIAVQELDQLDVRNPIQQASHPRVASTRHREARARVELDEVGSVRARELRAAVGRAAVDVDDRRRLRARPQRRETAGEPRALVSADHDHTELRALARWGHARTGPMRSWTSRRNS